MENVTVMKAILVRISSIPNLIDILKGRKELAKTVRNYVNEFCRYLQFFDVTRPNNSDLL
jgi:hypothetical protein